MPVFCHPTVSLPRRIEMSCDFRRQLFRRKENRHEKNIFLTGFTRRCPTMAMARHAGFQGYLNPDNPVNDILTLSLQLAGLPVFIADYRWFRYPHDAGFRL